MSRRRILSAVVLTLVLVLVAGATVKASVQPAPRDRYTAKSAYPAISTQYYYNEARGAAYAADHTLWVADTVRNQLVHVTKDGKTTLKRVGGYGKGNGRFSAPQGIAIASNGDIYVADTGSNRIQVLNSKGEYLRKFGVWGAGDGQFKQPVDVAVDNAGDLWVVESGNNRIQKLTPQGAFILRIGGPDIGNAAGSFNYPNGVACDTSGTVFVADSSNNRIQMFATSTGAWLNMFGKYGSEGTDLWNPYDIWVGASGRLYVANAGGATVKAIDYSPTAGASLYSTVGGRPTKPGETYFDGPFMNWLGVVTRDNASGDTSATPMAALDGYGMRVFTGDFANPSRLLCAGPDGKGLNKPRSVAAGANGAVWVFDDSFALQRFEYVHGALMYKSSVTTWGPDSKLFFTVDDMDCDADGNVYLLRFDGIDWRIVKFDANGAYLKDWIATGPPDGKTRSATGIGVGDGKVCVAENNLKEVEVFNTDGDFLGKLPSPPTAYSMVYDVAVSANAIYVCDYINSTLKRFSPSAPFDYVEEIGVDFGAEPGSFRNPTRLALDTLGNLYVQQRFYGQIDKLTKDGEFLSRMESVGVGSGEFSRNGMTGIDISPQGTMFVLDEDNNRVTAFEPNLATSTRTSGPSTVAYGGSANITAKLLDADGNLIGGQKLKFEYSYDGKKWYAEPSAVDAKDGIATITRPIKRNTWYRARFDGGDLYKASAGTSALAFKVSAKVKSVSTPSAPSKVRAGKTFTSYGYLDPRHAAGAKSVRILKYLKVGKTWKSYGYVSAKNYNAGSKTKYAVTMSLPKTGTWKLVASAVADADHALTNSASYKTVTVTK